ncbi:hypothetical protein D3C80_979110 [compost metagenome]
MKRMSLGLVFALIGSCTMHASPVVADQRVGRGNDGSIIVQDIKTKPVTAVAQGAGCVTVTELKLGYRDFAVLGHMFGTKRCARIDSGDKLQLVEGSHVEGNPLVKIYQAPDVLFYVPGYVFGYR